MLFSTLKKKTCWININKICTSVAHIKVMFTQHDLNMQNEHNLYLLKVHDLYMFKLHNLYLLKEHDLYMFKLHNLYLLEEHD